MSNQIILASILLFFLIFLPVKTEFECAEVINKINGYTCDEDNYIGKGAFGKTFKVTGPNGIKYAYKIDQNPQQKPSKEYDILKSLNHPNIIKVYEQFSEPGYRGVVLEYASKGNLKDFIAENPFYFDDSKVLFNFFAKLVDSIQYLADNRLVHADLKLENIVVNESDQPKLIDFDLAIEVGKEDPFKGTLSYIDPRIMLEYEPKKRYLYDSGNDVYALGVILYRITQNGASPFLSPNKEVLKKALLKGDYHFEKNTLKDVVRIVHACLQKNKLNRVSIYQLKHLVKTVIDNPNFETIDKVLELNNDGKLPHFLIPTHDKPFSLLEEFSEMIFVFLLAFLLIPILVYCFKRQFDKANNQNADRNVPLENNNQVQAQNQDLTNIDNLVVVI